MDPLNSLRELEKIQNISLLSEEERTALLLRGTCSVPIHFDGMKINPKPLILSDPDMTLGTPYIGDIADVARCKQCASGLVPKRPDGSFPDKCWQCGGGH